MRNGLAVAHAKVLLVFLGICRGVFGSDSAPGGPPALGPLTVTLASGRVLAAELDPWTDCDRLWIRWGREGVVIRQPIVWGRVMQVRMGERSFSGAEFAAAIKAHASQPVQPANASQSIPRTSAGVPTPRPPRPSLPSADAGSTRLAESVSLQPARVRSLAVDAQIANWNNSSEPDGLAVRVRPMDGDGRVLPVRGVLEVQFIGLRGGSSQLGYSASVLGRWVQAVEANDFTHDGARYRLAFQQAHPEVDLTIRPSGAVHVRLSVPGEGVFEATASATRVRPYSPLRDAVQQATGQRLLPGEAATAARH